MKIGALIREERKRKGLTQEQLANLIYKSRTTITKYETGDQVVPHDDLLNIIEVLRSPRLRLEVFGVAIAGTYLNNVDMHPVVVQQKAIEEMKEAVEALESFNLINKIGPEDLTAEEQKELVHNIMMELQDVVTCVNQYYIATGERYNLDLIEFEKSHKQKMIAKDYRREEAAG